MRCHSRCFTFAVCLIAISCSTATAEPNRNTQPQANDPVVEFFQAIQDEHISVRFIPIDASRGNVLIANQTDAPINVKLPSAFAAVPVLAQLGGQGLGQQGLGQQGLGQQGFGQQAGGGGGGNNQTVGGGMNLGGRGQGQQLGGGNNQQAGGFMRIAPERTQKLKAITVCLEHGKPEPNPRIAYTIMPIAKYTDDARIAELCRQLAKRELPQNVAQAAAWHLANGLDWNRLAKLNRVESKYLGNIRFFNPSEIDRATAYVESLSTTQDPHDYMTLTPPTQ